MARLTPLWMQNGAYAAVLDRQVLGSLWPAGGVEGMTPAVVVGTMQVQIGAGKAAVPDARVGGATYLCGSDAPENVQLPPAPPGGMDRYDLIVVRPRDAAYAGADNDWIFDVVSGPPSANPGVPAVPAGTIPIAHQRVIGGTPNLSAADLIDRRLGALETGRIPHSGSAVNAGGGGTSWIFGGWGNWPPSGTPTPIAIPFTKYRDDTNLKVICATTCYTGTGFARRTEFGFRIDTGIDRIVGGCWVTANERSTMTGSLVVPGVAAGPHTVTMRANWPGPGAGDSLNYGAVEFASMTVTEEYA